MSGEPDRPQVSTPTIGQLLSEEEERLFVGRGKELQFFDSWLEGSGARPLLNITGPGGIGKTALLAAYKRAADAEGRPTLAIDLSLMDTTPEFLLGRLGGPDVEQIAARWKKEGSIALLDGVEPGTPAARFLRQLLGLLTPEVPVVAAGRYPMASGHARHERWPFEVRTVELRGLTSEDAKRYLAGRGIEDASLQKEILDAAGGLPLALSLAADLVTRFGVRRFPAAPEWRMAVQSLVRMLLSDVDDPQLKNLLEVCAVVRHFDEDLLASVSRVADTRAAFDRLSTLTVVRASRQGLAFHDDVRRILSEDLRWRSPERFKEIRNRAQEHYRERARSATPEERQWLLGERMYLWENAFIQSLLYQDAELTELSLDVPSEEEIPDIIEIERRWHELARQEFPIDPSHTVESHMESMERLIRAPGARLRVVRDRTGRVQGFNLVLPVWKETFPILAAESVLGTLMEAYFTEEQRQDLPDRAEDSDMYYPVQGATLPDAPPAAQGFVLREMFSVIARSGLTLVSALRPEHLALLTALGFRAVPGSVNTTWGDDLAFQGFVLDLRVTGVEPWIRAVLEGRPAPALSRDELMAGMTAVLVGFNEPDVLSTSPLAAVVGPLDTPETVPRLRESLEEALRRGTEGAGLDGERALRAVELGYFRPLGSHERAAEQLNVSRATFFRLLKRGTELLATSWAELVRAG
jgi:hypothetical protein